MFFATLGQNQYQIELSGQQTLKGTVNGDAIEIDLVETSPDRFHVLQQNQSYNIEILEINREEKWVELKINGKLKKVGIRDRFDELLKNLGMENTNAHKVSDLKAPMPGLVLELRVTEGQEVQKGDPLLVLEAMKMENILKSTAEGIVSKILVTKGQAVEKGQVLLKMS